MNSPTYFLAFLILTLTRICLPRRHVVHVPECTALQHNRTVILLRQTYSHKHVYFFGDSISRNFAIELAIQLSELPNTEDSQDSRDYLCSPSSILDSLLRITPRSPGKHKIVREQDNLPVFYLPKLHPILLSQRDRYKEIFREMWADYQLYVNTTNTTILILFCATPDSLTAKFQRMIYFQYGPHRPDIVFLNVLLWSIHGSSISDRANRYHRDAHLEGRFNISDFSLPQFMTSLQSFLHRTSRPPTGGTFWQLTTHLPNYLPLSIFLILIFFRCTTSAQWIVAPLLIQHIRVKNVHVFSMI